MTPWKNCNAFVSAKDLKLVDTVFYLFFVVFFVGENNICQFPTHKFSRIFLTRQLVTEQFDEQFLLIIALEFLLDLGFC